MLEIIASEQGWFKETDLLSIYIDTGLFTMYLYLILYIQASLEP